MPVTEFGCMGIKSLRDVMDPSTPERQMLHDAWTAVTTAPGGPVRMHWGVELEDTSKIWTFFDWDSLSQHAAFAKSFGAQATKDFSLLFTPGFTKHLTLTPHPPSALDALVTEIMLAYFLADISPADQDAAAAQFQRFVDGALNLCPEVLSVNVGWGVERDFPVPGADGEGALFVALIGWPSVDAHLRFRETDEFKKNVGLIGDMGGLRKVDMFHVSCRVLERRE